MFRSLLKCSTLGLLTWALASATLAAGSDPRAELARKLPGEVKPGELAPTPVAGIYELRRGDEVAYVSADGRYLFTGQLLDLKTGTNLTEAPLNEARKKRLAAFPDSDTIVFGNERSKYTVTVFTDVNCGYCRKLHNEIQALNGLGIRVRYVLYPLAGPGSGSWQAAENVWCSADRRDALTRAKRGEKITASQCDAGSVSKQYQLGQSLSIQGTPAVFTNDGVQLGGYVPAAQMLARLNQLSTKR